MENYDIYCRFSRPFMDGTRGGFEYRFAAPPGAERGKCSCGLEHEGAVWVDGGWSCYDYVVAKGVTKEELSSYPLWEWI